MTDTGLVRFLPSGALDTTFGVDGHAAVPPQYWLDGLARGSDGRLVAVGTAGLGDSQDFAVFQFTAAGTLDPSFAAGGKVTTDLGATDAGRAIALQADGKIVVAGGGMPPGQSVQCAVLRYNADGSVDTTFGSTGKVVLSSAGIGDYADSVTIAADGKILVAGYSGTGPSKALVLARLNADGSLDTSFGSGGKTTSAVQGVLGWEHHASVALGAAGNILLAGSSHPGTTDDIMIGQYDGSGHQNASAATVGSDRADSFTSGARADQFDGLGGLDTVHYGGARSRYSVEATPSAVTVTEGSDGVVDTLVRVERAQFADRNVAFDLDGNAGLAAKILGATFGAAAVHNPNAVGIALDLVDAGMSASNLATLALSAAGANTPTEVVHLLLTNLIGPSFTEAQAAPIVELLTSGQIAAGALALIAANLDINAVNIGLVGLQESGLEYL